MKLSDLAAVFFPGLTEETHDRLLDYLMEQWPDLRQFLAYAVELKGWPTDLDQFWALLWPGLKWVLRHGTPTKEEVAACLADHPK